MGRAERAIEIKYDGAYRWATVTLTQNNTAVVESERVDKHYFPDGVPYGVVTPEVIEEACAKAVGVALERARGVIEHLQSYGMA